ncbi:hypothetical protein C8R46DRAFT_200442 [Mycena filopes]|nr:hypothetical protein C8R46DRAFT_200442 [Mycena filopes]
MDEFDSLPDPWANDNVDWTAILSAPEPAQPQPPSSPDLFPNDPVDDAFLAELDVIESSAPLASGSTTSTVHLSHLFSLPVPAPTVVSSPPRIGQKRSREPGIFTPSRKANTHSPPTSPSRRKRKRTVDIPRLVLAAFDDELTCPICCDLFVATHLLNPCGHSFCGDCAWQWVIHNKKTGCPVCRAPLVGPSRMIPNISMDKTVDVHLRMLADHGEVGWRIGGKLLAEFHQRQK